MCACVTRVCVAHMLAGSTHTRASLPEALWSRPCQQLSERQRAPCRNRAGRKEPLPSGRGSSRCPSSRRSGPRGLSGGVGDLWLALSLVGHTQDRRWTALRAPAGQPDQLWWPTSPVPFPSGGRLDHPRARLQGPRPGRRRSIRKWSPPRVPFPGDSVSGDWGAPRLGSPGGRYRAASDRSLNTPSTSHTTGVRKGAGRQEEAPSTAPGQGAFTAPSCVYPME